MKRAPAPAKINLALVVGPPRDDGKHELAHGLPAHRPRRPDRSRAGAGRSASRASRATRSSRAALELLAAARRQSSRAGACGSRSGSLSPPVSAAAAPTRRPRFGSRTRRSPSRCRRASSTRSPPGSAPTCPFFLVDGPQLGSGDGTSSQPLDLPQDFWVVAPPPERRGEELDRRRLRGVRRAQRRRRLGGARGTCCSTRSPRSSGRATSPRCRRTTSRARRSPTS